MAGGSKPGEHRGGRKRGTPNKINATTRERIEREADPIGFLVNVVNGRPIEVANPVNSSKTVTVYPNYEQRQDAAKTLAKKVLPDLKAVEHSGDVGVRHEDMTDAELIAIARGSSKRTPEAARSPPESDRVH